MYTYSYLVESTLINYRCAIFSALYNVSSMKISLQAINSLLEDNTLFLVL